ncbi:UDP-N-acetylmuramoyl-L-alanyl-D-glutamate--2,6-diaminopimelate ligase [Thiomicrorhabdus hydrogeniphila]
MVVTNQKTDQQAKTVEQIAQFLVEYSACFDRNLCLKAYQKNEITRPGKNQKQSLIKHCSLDSREITQGDLFLAIEGEQRHGIDFLQQVLTKLPGLVICDRNLTKAENLLLQESLQQSNKPKTEVWIVKDIKTFIGDFAAWFYNQPSQKIKVVGITGTNGKTSSAFFTGQLLKQLGKKVALIGTLGNGPIDAIKQSNNTTPESVTVHRLLHEFYQQGIEWVIMEVSSHGLCLGRIQGVVFQTVALTQVTRDHIDFHGTESAYKETKKRLFTEYKTQNQVINLDDAVGQDLCLLANNTHNNQWCYGTHSYTEQANLQCVNSQLTPDGIMFDAMVKDKANSGTTQKENQEFNGIKLPLMGVFNLENCLCASSILLVNGFNAEQVFAKIPTLQSVAGRMQILAKSPTIILDFAHTPDALQQVLKAVKAHLQESKGKLTVVFGCGGNRDQGKRPLMGKVAEDLADNIMVTTDNPRDEQPEQIIKEIEKGLSFPQKAMQQIDRTQAILSVLSLAKKEDIIVIAGKGHEEYQEIKGVKHPYSDAAVVKNWLQQ